MSSLLQKSEKANLLPLHGGDLNKSPTPTPTPTVTLTRRQAELARAEAVGRRAEAATYRPVLAVIYVAAFLFLFQFLAGTSFVSAILDEIKAAQVPQTFP